MHSEQGKSFWHFAVVPLMLQKLLCEGRDQILPSGPKPVTDSEEFKQQVQQCVP